jgi:hypothetical protein
LVVDSWAFLDELVYLLLIGGKTMLRAFCSTALWQIHETLCVLFRVQEYRFTTPSQDAGIQIYNSFSGYRNHSGLHGGWDTHSSPFRSLDPTMVTIVNNNILCI